MLDEPFTALDANNIRLVKELTQTFVTEMKIPCLIVTHRINDSRDVGDKVCIICRGGKDVGRKTGGCARMYVSWRGLVTHGLLTGILHKPFVPVFDAIQDIREC
ncbi:MAG: hypothetical protein WC620_09350 [Methanoregula sp.]|jgi:energy-coupling factor transporter ATP-binding protein EcfA2